MMARVFCSCVLSLIAAATVWTRAQQSPGAPQAARPQRSEADARQAADRHRQERDALRKSSGKPAEIMADCSSAARSRRTGFRWTCSMANGFDR